MRGSKWDLIKPLLKTLQETFPAEICVALIIKPDNFWQKQKTNFGSAKFTFEVSGTLCSTSVYNEEILPERFGQEPLYSDSVFDVLRCPTD